MQTSFRGLRRLALSVFALWGAAACGRGVLPAAPNATPAPQDAMVEEAGATAPSEAPLASKRGAEKARESNVAMPSSAPTDGEFTVNQATGDRAPTPNKRMLEIEGHLEVEVRDVEGSVAKLRSLVAARGGTITQDALQSEDGSQRAMFTFRIPASDTGSVLPELERLGTLHHKDVQARDVSKEYFDAELRLRNLRLAMDRYAQLYEQTSNVDELLRIENELTRLRGEIEQLEGTLRYMRDRVAQATIHVTLWAPGSFVEDVVHPKATFYPGVRAGWAQDFGSTQSLNGFASLGVSARFTQRTSLDLDVLRTLSDEGARIDGFWLTFGADTYSEFLGNGTRSFLNPYLGVRAGYGHRVGGDEFLAGIAVGLELVKTEMVTLELDLRTLGAFGKEAGSRVVVQPTLGANVAF